MKTIIFALLLVTQTSFAQTDDNSIRCKSKDGATELNIAIGQDKSVSIVSFKNRGKTLISNLSAKAVDGQTQYIVSGSGFTFVGEQGFATAEVAYLKDANNVFKASIFCKYPRTAISEIPDNNL